MTMPSNLVTIRKPTTQPAPLTVFASIDMAGALLEAGPWRPVDDRSGGGGLMSWSRPGAEGGVLVFLLLFSVGLHLYALRIMLDGSVFGAFSTMIMLCAKVMRRIC